MTHTLFLLFFCATAPVALMPTIIALLTRHKARWTVVGVNLALWAMIFFTARSFTLGSSSQFQVPTVVALGVWLGLLGYTIRTAGSGRR
ncbi:hypothetical protein LVB77_14445 [Lysobacter sp. 5GHs7-4]|uniref:hypothetical protein n=1 Tax=Lysobacter sp. 5GHs7-4 TaxID=2904253 RepID=UPI001E53ACB1|nr:hypothetical protein [Lysobacter sp. 5GHs7-4]UHQ21865.1 hypothetical protein LVB77_14445 [Lysobacter sp. 5GHs7-4]